MVVSKTLDLTAVRGECSIPPDDHDRFIFPVMQERNPENAARTLTHGERIPIPTIDFDYPNRNYTFIYKIREREVGRGNFYRYFTGDWRKFVVDRRLRIGSRVEFSWVDPPTYMMRAKVLDAEEDKDVVDKLDLAIPKKLRSRRRGIEAAKVLVLLGKGPHILVCDEAQIIKNTRADTTQALKQVKCQGRIVLNGSPLQNNLMEYYCMVDFVGEEFLGSSHEFRNRFRNPIENGQHVNSTAEDVKLMNQRSHILYEQLKGFVQRMGMNVVIKDLPPKSIFVITMKLSPLQRKLYKRFLDVHGSAKDKISSEEMIKRSFFAGYQALAQIWNHPGILQLRKDDKDSAKCEDVEADGSSSDEIVDYNVISGEKLVNPHRKNDNGFLHEVTKEGLAARVVDRQQVHRTMSKEEILHLFDFGDDGNADILPELGQETAELNTTGHVGNSWKQKLSLPHGTSPSDKLIESLISRHHRSWIANYHDPHKIPIEEPPADQVVPELLIDPKPVLEAPKKGDAALERMWQRPAYCYGLCHCTNLSHFMTLKSQRTMRDGYAVCGECAEVIRWEDIKSEPRLKFYAVGREVD